jgi:hypothetical protein
VIDENNEHPEKQASPRDDIQHRIMIDDNNEQPEKQYF